MPAPAPVSPVPALSPAASPLHFGLLDGLRGVAALAVVLFHFMELVETKPANNFIAHAYLAVDFFFCLSGFVIAYAYDARLAQLGVGRFLRRRLIRLHPLVVVGALLGLLTFWLDPFSHLVDQYATRLPLLLLSSCLLVPYPVVTERYVNLFHLNPPTWSLFWEYIANVAYALVLVRLPARLLKILLVPAAIALCYEARRTGSLSGGWGSEDAIAGFLRVTFSFLMGLLLYRAHWLIRSRLGFGALALLLLGALLLPFVDRINWRVDSLVVLFYFPLLIALGAGGQLTPRYAKLCRFLGDISYPLYIVHYPFIWVFFSYLHKYQPPLSTLALVIPTAMPALVLLAYAVLKWIDIPVRSYLTRTFDQPTTLVSNRQAPAPVAYATHP